MDVLANMQFFLEMSFEKSLFLDQLLGPKWVENRFNISLIFDGHFVEGIFGPRLHF